MGQSTTGQVSGRTDAIRLIGRAREQSVVQRAIDAGFEGAPGIVAITGEAGIGKSTLAAHLAGAARERGARVLYGSADELDRSAFGLWREPWARLGGSSRLVDPGLSSDDQRWDVLARMSEELQRAAPVMIVLEDLHWADSLSRWVLARLAPGLVGDAVAIVATCRREGADELVEQVRPAEVVRLGGLDETEITELVRTLAPERTVDAGELLARTSGNPLFIRELVRTQSDGVTELVGSTLEYSFASLTDACRTVLEALSLAGTDTPIAVLAGALTLRASDIIAALDEGVRRDVLVRRPLGAVAFRHALLADAASSSLDTKARRELHARFATAWPRSTVPDAAFRSARHLVNAVPAVDPVEAARIARSTAAAMIAVGDVTGGAELLEDARAALELSVAEDLSLEAGLLLDLAGAQEASGDVVAAAATFEAAARAATRAGDAETAARAEAGAARRVVMWIDDPDRRKRLEDAAQRLPPGDHPLRIDLYGRLAVLCLARPDLSAAGTRWGDEAVAMARRIGDPALIASALIDRHLAPITPEDLAALGGVIDELLATAERSGRADLVLVALQWQYGARIARADLAGAHAAVLRLEALAAVMPSPLWRYGALLRRAMLHTIAGERDLALECIDDAWLVGQRLLDRSESIGLDVGSRTFVARVFGVTDPQLEAHVPFARHQPMRSEIAFFDVHYSLSALLTGDTATARVAVMKWGPIADQLLYGYQAPTTVVLLGLLIAEQGIEDHAARVHDVLAPYSGWLTLETSLGAPVPVDYILGRLSTVAGDYRAAVASLRIATELTSQLPGPALEASARWELAHALEGAGDVSGSRAERRKAEALAARTGVVLSPSIEPLAPRVSERARLVRHSRTWTIESPLGSAEVAHSTGMAQLARVLGAAPHEVEAVSLAGRDEVVERDLGPALDATAKRAYRMRLAELRAEIDDADDHADIERAARARVELDALMSELQQAVGLGGRDRPVGSSAEKARINVARSLRRAIAAIAVAAPSLGSHLDVSIRTGRACRYAPDPAVALSWMVES